MEDQPVLRRRRRQHAPALNRRCVPLSQVTRLPGGTTPTKEFVRDLIDHAHPRGVKVLLGFTPFGYDGVNQYPLEHPELKAVGKDGKPVAPFGIGCWGYNLCPSRPESQRFMLEYARELAFDFYPDADGLLIESSDYA